MHQTVNLPQLYTHHNKYSAGKHKKATTIWSTHSESTDYIVHYDCSDDLSSMSRWGFAIITNATENK